MAVIVKDTKTEKQYLLIGSGFGAYKSVGPSLLFQDSGEMAVVAVCNDEGKIGWAKSKEIRVVSIDGKSPLEWLKGESRTL